MSYDSEIAEIEMMPFADLYKLTSGNRVFFYTSYHKDITFQGNEYQAIVMKATVPKVNDNLKPNRIQITMPVVNPIGEYISVTPLEPTEFQITRVFPHDLLAFSQLFLGKVLGVTFVDNGDFGVAIAQVESNTLFLRNKVPRVTFKAFCNNTLFLASEMDDEDCNLDQTPFEVNATIAIVDSTLTSASFALHPDGYFRGGHIETAYGDFRLITNHVTNVVTLNVPFDERLVGGASVLALPGDDKSPTTCTDKFNNFTQFKGFPYIPSNNPSVFGADR